jgi:hypothetical protein
MSEVVENLRQLCAVSPLSTEVVDINVLWFKTKSGKILHTTNDCTKTRSTHPLINVPLPVGHRPPYKHLCRDCSWRGVELFDFPSWTTRLVSNFLEYRQALANGSRYLDSIYSSLERSLEREPFLRAPEMIPFWDRMRKDFALQHKKNLSTIATQGSDSDHPVQDWRTECIAQIVWAASESAAVDVPYMAAHAWKISSASRTLSSWRSWQDVLYEGFLLKNSIPPKSGIANLPFGEVMEQMQKIARRSHSEEVVTSQLVEKYWVECFAPIAARQELKTPVQVLETYMEELDSDPDRVIVLNPVPAEMKGLPDRFVTPVKVSCTNAAIMNATLAAGCLPYAQTYPVPAECIDVPSPLIVKTVEQIPAEDLSIDSILASAFAILAE